MNEKLIKVARAEGFCCMWAFLEANRQVYTSELVRRAREAGITLTPRAIRHQRREYRRRGSSIKCEQLSKCLLEKIKAGDKTP